MLEIFRLNMEVRGDAGFAEMDKSDVQELIDSIEEPLTSDEVLEMKEATQTYEEEETPPDMPQKFKEELTIPVLKFMQHITSTTESALQCDPNIGRSMPVIKALRRASLTYSRLLAQRTISQQHRKIPSFFHPLLGFFIKV